VLHITPEMQARRKYCTTPWKSSGVLREPIHQLYREFRQPSHLQSADHVEQKIRLRSKNFSFADLDNLAVVEHEPVVALAGVADVVPAINLPFVNDDARELVDQTVRRGVRIVIGR
jgi:hypothetical protein